MSVADRRSPAHSAHPPLLRVSRRCVGVAEPWNRLSTELILHIFNYLEPHDLASCARVCQYWKRVT